MSYSEYMRTLEQWYEKIGPGWSRLQEEAMTLLKEEEELREIVSLVGAEILGDKQRCVFEAAKMLKEYFLLQSALHPVDMYCPLKKTYDMLRLILRFYEKAKMAVDLGVSLTDVLSLGVREDLIRMKIVRPEEFSDAAVKIESSMDEQFTQIIQKVRQEKQT